MKTQKSTCPKSQVSEQFEPPPSLCLQSLMPPPCAKPDPSMLIPPNFEERPCPSQSYSRKLHLHPKPLSCPYPKSAPLPLQSLQKVVRTVKNLPATQETRVWSLGWEDPLAKGMATHSGILAWRIPWTEKSGGLHSPSGRKELDTTGWLTLSLFFFLTITIELFSISKPRPADPFDSMAKAEACPDPHPWWLHLQEGSTQPLHFQYLHQPLPTCRALAGSLHWPLPPFIWDGTKQGDSPLRILSKYICKRHQSMLINT